MQDGCIREFDANYSLLSPLVCDALAFKEGRKTKRKLDATQIEMNGADESELNDNMNNDDTQNNTDGAAQPVPTSAILKYAK